MHVRHFGQMAILVGLIGALLNSDTLFQFYTRNPAQNFVIRAALITPLGAPTEDPVAEAIRELLSKNVDKFFKNRTKSTAVEAFYRSRDFVPLWFEKEGATARFSAANAYLQTVSVEGLNPEDYKTISPPGEDPVTVAARELAFTASILTYATHAQSGRFAPSRISPNISYNPQPIKVVDLLDLLARSSNVVEVLSSFHPHHLAYKALKTKLADLRSAERGAALPPNSQHEIASAIELIKANMERWRWMPRELGTAYVIVNIPDYSLEVIRNGSHFFRARIVVGTPALPTPVMTAAMTSITINPIWNVPASIAESEYLPRLKNDPQLLERIGLNLNRRADGSIHLYQLPGKLNVLGHVRFNLPNKFLVFQHDTPEIFLFENEMRAFSHGCVRVENAIYYAAALLSIVAPEKDYTPEQLAKMFGENEININFAVPIPVYFTYQTAFVDEGGALRLLHDIYDHDAGTLAMLKIETEKTRDVLPAGFVSAGREHSALYRLRRWLVRHLEGLRYTLASAGELGRLSPQ